MKQKPGKPRHHYEEPPAESSYTRRLIFETGHPMKGPEPLAAMDYREELRCKDRAFSSYWYDISGDCAASPLIASPLPRQYRTTTKRRVHTQGGRVILSSDESSLSDSPSLLEPEFHAVMYSKLSAMLNETANRRISGFLNFVILRGNYESAAVIFNATVMNSETVKSLTKIADQLKESSDRLTAAFIYHDPEGSKYYLNTSSEIEGHRMKRLFGNRNLSIKVQDVLYTFAPDSFSQVNLSICGAMLTTAEHLLSHEGKGRLLDLYCGYGFFSCYLGKQYDEVTGIDYGKTAIDSARENMKHTTPRGRWDFHAKRIEKRLLREILPQGRLPEYILLDPPRNGTAPGVIETLADRGPELVLHIFCDLETIPYELEKWDRGGYRPAACVPLDMFPGTPELEVMVLLKRFRSPKTGHGKRGR
ncbi:MAG TPA: methyltransferase [Spirochaetota bacterium]|nr:methyltransferase [Spirochaetota bacterium]